MVDRGSFSNFACDLSFVDERVRSHAPVDSMTPLPMNWIPDNSSVICGRGRDAYNHIGNRRFRILVDLNIPKYMNAPNRVEKSVVVMKIVDTIRECSGDGGFVKQDPKTGRWFEVGDAVAREKVGQQFRTAISQIDPTRHVRKRQRERKSKKSVASSNSQQPSSTDTAATATATARVASADASSETNSHRSSFSSRQYSVSSSTSSVATTLSGQQVHQNRRLSQKRPIVSQSSVLSTPDPPSVGHSTASIHDNYDITMPHPPSPSDRADLDSTPRIRNIALSSGSTNIEEQKLPASDALSHLAYVAGSREALLAAGNRHHQQPPPPPKTYMPHQSSKGDQTNDSGKKSKTLEWYSNYSKSQF